MTWYLIDLQSRQTLQSSDDLDRDDPITPEQAKEYLAAKAEFFNRHPVGRGRGPYVVCGDKQRAALLERWLLNDEHTGEQS